MRRYDVVVIGLGHAGIEAAVAAARLGARVAAFTLSRSTVGLLPCNPAMGGPAKGQLVREVDALGGVQGILSDRARVQIRVLNSGKGPAVRALRAQVDKDLYPRLARDLLEETAGLTVFADEVVGVEVREGRVRGVLARRAGFVAAGAVVLTTGVYLRGRVVIGQERRDGGPQGLPAATKLAESLLALGFPFRRFKTGTSPRVRRSTVRFEALDELPGDEGDLRLSFLPGEAAGRPNLPSYATHTTDATHALVRAHLALSPLYNGVIEGKGPRYCPSLEDKVVRFAERGRHPVFLELETVAGESVYLSGVSTSLPRGLQESVVHSIPGLEVAEIIRYGYAIEYDALDPTELGPDLMARRLPGFFAAGSANGTSGYEEAAAQGIVAGINAVRHIGGEEAFVLGRHEAYIGVLVDDLTLKGTLEPYRMLTSRAEHRLLLRQDNADLRLTPRGRALGLVDDRRYEVFLRRQEAIEALATWMATARVGTGGRAQERLRTLGKSPLRAGTTVAEALKRPELSAGDFRDLEGAPDWSEDVAGEVEARIKYEGYVAREEARVARAIALEGRAIPADFEFRAIRGLSNEARERLERMRPRNLGEASRVAGVSPADVAVLQVALARRGDGRLG
jgi:tRNA uridine 5-carboxymethylaminomethyl modification enzyme